MLKIKNSTILFIGILLISFGLIVGSFEYLRSKKDKAFSKMNIMLYESEMPKNIEVSDAEEPQETPTGDEKPQDNPGENNGGNSGSSSYSYSYIGTVSIPKINLKKGFLDLSSRYNNINYNVTVINGSTFPDEENSNLILAAHSGNCYYCYFDNLYLLNVGDVAYINYKGIDYKYVIVKIYEVEKNGTVTIYRNHNKKVLTLITCTRNVSNKQTVYILELEE